MSQPHSQLRSVVYEVRDTNNTVVSSGSIKIDPSELIGELKRAVYNANDSSLPSNCRYTHLSVYPPNTADYHSSQPIEPEYTIQDVLNLSSLPKPRIILIAHPPPLSTIYQ